ncbi:MULTISPECIES: type II secretion system protein GspL [unclassified Pseudomonas]|uniref:type II secretion system protein GspL n=1 Tax=unclassified Pseudomonas TaxID=196821 RepID=UPI000D016548|nr:MULTISPECIES: type II secretion system protein GspL [unclassified Pseudomonas]PRN04396.1 type II secretion system protein GspL [Pseudomonas sp. LLC-1]PYG73470.1 general secretion pathway protein L [Pseudomonas sp. RV120224-01c]PYG77759.1 general secretion pathway protein L [Pseudomonas sp. RV120224-01b]
MKFEWRRRTPAQPWLLLRPGVVWHWALTESGVVQRQGQGEPPANLQARVALILPAEACSCFRVPAPPGLKREEWSLLLEDCLLQPPDEVACACLAREPGHLRLLVVARQKLEGWRGQCAAWGLQVERCWAEPQLLPAVEAGTAWHWQRPPGMSLYTGLGEDEQEHWLAWPDALGEMPQQPWAHLQKVPLSGDWPSALAPLDSLPGLFERGRKAPSLPVVSRPQQRLLAACLVLAAVWGSLWLSQQWRQAQLWRAQVIAVTGEQASPRHAAQALKRLRESGLQQQVRTRQLEDLQATLQAWLRDHPGWRLQAVRFDGQRWQLRLEGDGAAPPWQEIAKAADAAVEVQGGEVVFDLGAAA